jgi:hypothetical protein
MSRLRYTTAETWSWSEQEGEIFASRTPAILRKKDFPTPKTIIASFRFATAFGRQSWG